MPFQFVILGLILLLLMVIGFFVLEIRAANRSRFEAANNRRRYRSNQSLTTRLIQTRHEENAKAFAEYKSEISKQLRKMNTPTDEEDSPKKTVISMRARAEERIIREELQKKPVALVSGQRAG